MWELERLIASAQGIKVNIKGKFVPSRPGNFKPKWCSIWKRICYAWQVVIGKAETFTWPEGQ